LFLSKIHFQYQVIIILGFVTFWASGMGIYLGSWFSGGILGGNMDWKALDSHYNNE